MTVFPLIVLFSLIGGAFSIIGGLLLLYREDIARKLSIYLLSFAAGTLLAVAFLDLLPEALEALLDQGAEPAGIFMAAIGGFLLFFLVEGLLFQLHHHHAAEDDDHCKDTHVSKAPTLLVVGDTLHNLVDGIAITSAFLISIPTGIGTAIAVAAHEIPQEIGDFSVMIHAGWKRKEIILWNLLPALATTVGAIITFLLRDKIEFILGYLLAGTAGIFIYIAASDLLPELYHVSRRDQLKKTIPLLFLGIIVMAIGITLAE